MSNRKIIAITSVCQAIMGVIAGVVMGNPAGAIVLGVAIGAPLHVVLMRMALRRLDAQQLPRARVVRPSDAGRQS